MLRHLYSDTSPKSPRHLSDSSPCYRNGHFAFWFYSSVFCDSSLSDKELGFGMMTVLSAILWSRSSLGLMPLLVSCTFVACRSLCINVHAPPCSADTAVRSDFPLRFSRHTATAVPQSLHTDCLLANNLCSIVLPRLFLNWVIWKPLILPCKGSVMLRRTFSFLCGRYRCDQ